MEWPSPDTVLCSEAHSSARCQRGGARVCRGAPCMAQPLSTHILGTPTLHSLHGPVHVPTVQKLGVQTAIHTTFGPRPRSACPQTNSRKQGTKQRRHGSSTWCEAAPGATSQFIHIVMSNNGRLLSRTRGLSAGSPDTRWAATVVAVHELRQVSSWLTKPHRVLTCAALRRNAAAREGDSQYNLCAVSPSVSQSVSQVPRPRNRAMVRRGSKITLAGLIHGQITR